MNTNTTIEYGYKFKVEYGYKHKDRIWIQIQRYIMDTNTKKEYGYKYKDIIWI